MNNIGLGYLNLGDIVTGLSYFLDSLNMRKKLSIGDIPEIAESYLTVGLFYGVIKNYSEALRYLLFSLDMRK